MPTNSNIYSTNSIIHRLEKGNYVSFSSINPIQFGINTSYINKTQEKVYTGIIEDVDNGTVIIRSQGPRLPSEPSLNYRQQEVSVKLLRKKHLYLRCRESPRKPWYGSVGSGHILQFDLNGEPAGYKQEDNTTATQQLWFTKVAPKHKPSRRIPPSGPLLLLSEDNQTFYKVSNTSTTPTFTQIPLNPPILPPKRINRKITEVRTTSKGKYIFIHSPPSPSIFIHSPPSPSTTHLQQYTFLPTLPTPPPSPTKPTPNATTLTIKHQQPNIQTISKYFT